VLTYADELQAAHKEARAFLTRFIDTQMFNGFLEKRLCGSGRSLLRSEAELTHVIALTKPQNKRMCGSGRSLFRHEG
jgi:hypothetical protein